MSSDQPRRDVCAGQRWRLIRDLRTGGLTSWRVPFSGGFECVVPSGTVVAVESDPPIRARAVYCIPENYDELECLLVPEEDRDSPKYSGYALVIQLVEFGAALVAVE